MKEILYIILLTVAVFTAKAQQDPEAKKILDRVSAKAKSYSTIEANLTFIIDNRVEDWKTETTGKIKIKGQKYYMESETDKYYYNGKTIWNYNMEDNEVVITESDPENETFVDNPALVFQFYNRDFKYRYVGEVKIKDQWMYEIDLYPKDLNQPYSRIKVLVNKNTEQIYKIKAVTKEGIDFVAIITNIEVNKTFSDSMFEFDPGKIRNIEIIDLRAF